MPGLNGDQVCRRVRERVRERYIYLLLLTAKSHKSDLIHGLNAGADDYLVKPVDPMELKARLNTGRRILGLQEQLIAAREAMRRQAMRDSLTGAWNHAAILDILKRELARAERDGGSAERRPGRPRSLQARQRHVRPPGRRRGAVRGPSSHGRRDAALRHDRPLRRRGVPDRPAGLRRDGHAAVLRAAPRASRRRRSRTTGRKSP